MRRLHKLVHFSMPAYRCGIRWGEKAPILANKQSPLTTSVAPQPHRSERKPVWFFNERGNRIKQNGRSRKRNSCVRLQYHAMPHRAHHNQPPLPGRGAKASILHSATSQRRRQKFSVTSNHEPQLHRPSRHVQASTVTRQFRPTLFGAFLHKRHPRAYNPGRARDGQTHSQCRATHV